MIRWANDKVIFLDAPNPALEELLDAKFKRRFGLLQWDVPSIGAVQQAMSFVSTVVGGFADDATVEKRRASCFSCPARIEDRQGSSYCGGCKCGKWKLATLDGGILPKLKLRNLKCPLGRF